MHTHTQTHNTRSLSHTTLIISIMFPFKKCSESCNALTLKRCLLSLCSDFEAVAETLRKVDLS